MFNAWLFAKRLKKFRQMKQMEAGEGLQHSPGVARDFHSSSPGNGEKVDEAGTSDVVAFDGNAGPEVAFVDRDPTESGDTEYEDLDGVPVC